MLCRLCLLGDCRGNGEERRHLAWGVGFLQLNSFLWCHFLFVNSYYDSLSVISHGILRSVTFQLCFLLVDGRTGFVSAPDKLLLSSMTRLLVILVGDAATCSDAIVWINCCCGFSVSNVNAFTFCEVC